jgi:hypothetical protein
MLQKIADFFGVPSGYFLNTENISGTAPRTLAPMDTPSHNVNSPFVPETATPILLKDEPARGVESQDAMLAVRALHLIIEQAPKPVVDALWERLIDAPPSAAGNFAMREILRIMHRRLEAKDPSL